MERRFFSTSRCPIELRCEGDAKPSLISGYAAVYYRADDPGTEFEIFSFPGFSMRERLMPGCFDRAIKEDDIRALFNHDPSRILGRLSSGSLRLTADAKGLRYEIDPGDTSVARDVAAWIQRGEITGSSIAFDYLQKSTVDQSDQTSEKRIIEVRDVKLFDVGPVTFPAYSATTANARSLSTEADRLAKEYEAKKRLRLKTRVNARIVELGI